MIALIQRVTKASVQIEEQQQASIKAGILALIGIQKSDTNDNVVQLVNKLLHFRVFPDKAGRMNLDVSDAQAELLLVPQFTLAADTSSGRRPGFSTAADPRYAEELFGVFCDRVEASYSRVQRGVFGADMKVALINDGPVTFWLQT